MGGEAIFVIVLAVLALIVVYMAVITVPQGY